MPGNEENDTQIIERGFVALARKFLESKIVWRAFATIALSFGIVQRQLPAKVDVVANTTPLIQQVSKEDFDKLLVDVANLRSSMDDLKTKLADMSGQAGRRNKKE